MDDELAFSVIGLSASVTKRNKPEQSMNHFFHSNIETESGKPGLIYIDPEQGAPRIYSVLPKENEPGLSLNWATALMKAKGMTTLTDYFSAEPGYEHCRIACDLNGCLYLLDEKHQKAEFIHHYGIDYTQAVMLSDGRTLAVMYESKATYSFRVELWQFVDAQLCRSAPIELDWGTDDDDKDEAEEVYPEPAYDIRFDDQLFAGPDNSLILYACRDSWFSDQINRPLQYLMRIDLDVSCRKASIRTQQLEISPKKWQAEHTTIAIDKKRGLLAMPSTIIQADDLQNAGQQNYLHAVNLIDLNRMQRAGEPRLPVQELTVRVPVRVFTQAELGERIQPDNHRQVSQFINRMSGLQMSESEDALWICWQDGAVRKVALDGQWRSPILAVADQDNPERIRQSGGGDYLLRPPVSASHPQILIGSWHSLHTLNLTTEQLVALSLESPGAALETWSAVQEEKCYWGEDWSRPENQNDDQKYQLTMLGKQKVWVSDFQSEQALGTALHRLSLKCTEIETLCTGNYLMFAFTDGHTVWDEAKFFSTVIQLPNVSSAEWMADILNSFIGYDGSDYCFSENDKPALADCALHLGLSDSRWLPLISRYLNAIDPDHEAFFAGEGVDILASRHGNSPEWESFYQSLPDTMAYHEDDDDYFDHDDIDGADADEDSEVCHRSDEAILASIPAELLAQLAEKKQVAKAAYQQLLDRIEQAETQAQIGVLLDEWLHESHNAEIDPEIASFIYWYRFEEWFKTKEHKALEAEIESYFSDPMDSFVMSLSDDDDIDFDLDTYLDALFEKAEALQCWELLARYLRQQIQWIKEINHGDALYAEELPYGNYAAEALLRHDVTRYGALYVEFLSTFQYSVPEETVGEFLREIIPELGITTETYPIILARLTFAADQHGREDFADWCETLSIRDWLYEHNLVESFVAAVRAHVERYHHDEDDVKESVDEIREMLQLES